MLFPFKYFSGKGDSIKFSTAKIAASLSLQFSELIADQIYLLLNKITLAPKTVKYPRLCNLLKISAGISGIFSPDLLSNGLKYISKSLSPSLKAKGFLY